MQLKQNKQFHKPAVTSWTTQVWIVDTDSVLWRITIDEDHGLYESTGLLTYITRKLCYRKDDRAMRAI